MSLRSSLERTLASPTVADLWRLRAELLVAGLPDDAGVWGVLDQFQRYLDQLATSSTSREYSELASRLDISAVGGVVLEHVLEADDADELALRLLTGLLSEGLMVLATRQHVQAWAGELDAVYRGAAWYVYGALWRWAERRKPGLAAAERRRLLDGLFEPLLSDATEGSAKAVLLGLLFQVLLIAQLAPDLGRLQSSQKR